MNQKKVAETFIDDTLENFWHSELQKEKKNAVNTPKEEYLTTSCQVLFFVTLFSNGFKLVCYQPLIVLSKKHSQQMVIKL